MSANEQLLAANADYAAAFASRDLGAPPARRLAVVTCMDARLDPAKFLGLEEGDAHVIRNAGGIVTDDALRSLVISHHLLGTEHALVIGHTDCGMVKFRNDELRARLGPAAAEVDFMPFGDIAERVRESVRAIENSALLRGFGATGYVYDVRNGRISAV